MSSDRISNTNQQGKTKKSGQKGQALVEAILIMAITLGLVRLVSDVLVKNRIIEKMTSGPWEKLDGMIQCGDWKPCGLRNNGMGHPGASNRISSLKTR